MLYNEYLTAVYHSHDWGRAIEQGWVTMHSFELGGTRYVRMIRQWRYEGVLAPK